MSRRTKKPLSKSRVPDDRSRVGRPSRGAQADRPLAHRAGSKLPRFAEPRREKPARSEPVPTEHAKAGEPQLPTKVQTVVVTADENNMRVDRFLEARFPGLSFSHIQRVVRKGELRVNGKRADSKDRLEEGQSVSIPPLSWRMESRHLPLALQSTAPKSRCETLDADHVLPLSSVIPLEP